MLRSCFNPIYHLGIWSTNNETNRMIGECLNLGRTCCSRGESTIYHVVTSTINDHVPEGLEKVIEIITSWVVIAALIMILVLLAHYFRLKKNTTAKKIEGLKYQLTLVGITFLTLSYSARHPSRPKGVIGRGGSKI